MAKKRAFEATGPWRASEPQIVMQRNKFTLRCEFKTVKGKGRGREVSASGYPSDGANVCNVKRINVIETTLKTRHSVPYSNISRVQARETVNCLREGPIYLVRISTRNCPIDYRA